MRTVPAVGRCSAPTMLISVDLPEPDGPTITTNSPGRDGEVDAVEGVDGRAAGVVLRCTAGRARSTARSHSGTTTSAPPSMSPVDLDHPVGEHPDGHADEVGRAGRRRRPRRRSRPRPGRAGLDRHGQHVLGGGDLDVDVDRCAVGERRCVVERQRDREASTRRSLVGLRRPDRRSPCRSTSRRWAARPRPCRRRPSRSASAVSRSTCTDCSVA